MLDLTEFENAADFEDENWEFRTYLKQLNMSDEKLDKIVHEITTEVTSQINCRECARCCRGLNVYINPNEIAILASAKEISSLAFSEQFVLTDEEEDQYMPAPCAMLDGNDCSVYEARPGQCQTYPNLMKKDFRIRSIRAVQNSSMCPIVFHVFQELKEELW